MSKLSCSELLDESGRRRRTSAARNPRQREVRVRVRLRGIEQVGGQSAQEGLCQASLMPVYVLLLRECKVSWAKALALRIEQRTGYHCGFCASAPGHPSTASVRCWRQDHMID